MEKGMTLRQFLNSFNWTNVYFILDRVKWVSAYEDGRICDGDFETVYDETASNTKNDDIEPFLDIIIRDIIPVPNDDNEIAVLRLSEDIWQYTDIAKDCKDGVWERYPGACEWLADEL